MEKLNIVGSILIALCVAIPAFAASDNQHQFNMDVGYSNLDNGFTSDQVLTTTVGYSYYFSPFVGADLGYSGTMSGTAKLQDANGNAIETQYDSFFGGLRVETPITQFATIYGRGGVAYTKLKETYVGVTPGTSTTHSGMNPYLSAGARVQSALNRNLEFSAEVSYQDLDAGYSSTSFSVGARFRM